MHNLAKWFSLCLLMLGVTLATLANAQEKSTEKQSEQYSPEHGHSAHGPAFDVGPREKPWKMDGIGTSHFPITTSNPEVQVWFDQGHTLLHSFWYYEAERAFRWCLKLDPECAMAYWGLARANPAWGRSFLQEASKRKDRVTERERLYIEAWEVLLGTERRGQSVVAKASGPEELVYHLEKICLKYPDDIEAKSLLAWAIYDLNKWGNKQKPGRYGNELVIQQVLAADAQHPGALHYRIHTWDGPESHYVLDSCTLLSQTVLNIGHAQHMPGHIYSQLGMWHEAAIAMDTTNRIENRYFREHMGLPVNSWNYAHNRNYLSYIQEQLGMANAAIDGAKQLIAAPREPQYYNNPNEYGTHWQGVLALIRALVKFERWEEILNPDTFPWSDQLRDKVYQSYCETLAHLGLGDIEKADANFAAHTNFKAEVEKDGFLSLEYPIQSLELEARFALAKGESTKGIELLTEASKREFDMRLNENDPPIYPNVLYNILGRAYLTQGNVSLAVDAFEKTLELVPNDGFALSGLVEAYAAMGETGKARDAYARLLFVWSDADAGLKWFERAKAIGLDAEPYDNSPAPQRNYASTALDYVGPSMWAPFDAPRLDAVDFLGNQVTLEAYRGKNVLLIFHFGEECPDCLNQLIEVKKRYADLSLLNTEVLAISSDPPQKNATLLKMKEFPFRLLSDTTLENARRFKAYDDFEEMALHATILINKQSKVHWFRNGGDPFMDFDFLLKEIRRINDRWLSPDEQH